jgi:glycosyltransferase involved in cell wall biosynthesis
MDVKIYPSFTADFYSYYLQGLQEVTSTRLRLSLDGFPRFEPYGLAVVITGTSQVRVYIDAIDGSYFDQTALQWCDVYAKVNIDPDKIPEKYAHKIIAIGPSYGIRKWNVVQGIWLLVKSYWLLRQHNNKYIMVDRPKLLLSHYWAQFHRRPLNEYKPQDSLNSYVFFVSSLWTEDNINQARLLFMESCRALEGINFEGGFVATHSRRALLDLPQYQSLRLDLRIPLKEYIKRTKKSAIVFSTPAVHECHGWKLGEYLALGKAIISTPLSRMMPEPLIHGKHIHFVDGTKHSISEAVNFIHQNPDYRKYLEINALQYFSTYLQPRRVIERILHKAFH